MKKLTVGDLVIVVFLCLIALVPAVTILTQENPKAVVRVAVGNVVNEYDLTHDQKLEITSNGYHLAVQILEGQVCIVSTDCPDRICEYTGRISRQGSAIVCLPARVTVSIVHNVEVHDAIIG